jgi:hypothetical protein
MNEPENPPTVSFSLTYRNLRALFIAGFVLQCVLVFVPSLRMTVGSVMGYGGEVRTFSDLEIIRLLFQGGKMGLGTYLVILFCATATFAVLAIKYPRRWVFIAGSCFTIYGIIYGVFAGSDPNVQYLFLPRLLDYISSAMTLGGFWVRPPIATEPKQPTQA